MLQLMLTIPLHHQTNIAHNTGTSGNLSYVRRCTAKEVTTGACGEVEWPFTCLNGLTLCPPALRVYKENHLWWPSLTFPCSDKEINGIDGQTLCTNTPEVGYMMNPCMTAQALVEITNDGATYSGGEDLTGIGTELLSTARYYDARGEAGTGGGKKMYKLWKNFTIPPTAVVYTFVQPQFFYKTEGIMVMERGYCRLPRYSEESSREREQTFFALRAFEQAHLQLDLRHLPDEMVYDQHFRIAIFFSPSRCEDEECR
jgi:hypothetical protein